MQNIMLIPIINNIFLFFLKKYKYQIIYFIFHFLCWFHMYFYPTYTSVKVVKRTFLVLIVKMGLKLYSCLVIGPISYSFSFR